MTLPFNPRWRIKTDHLAALATTLAPIIYFLPAILKGAVLCPDDGLTFNTPLRVATSQIIHSGNLPLWNPYIFSGMPLFATAQGGLLFPPNWFYLFYSPAIATNLMVVTSYMIAALGAYLYARRTGVSITAAMVTSLIWQWSGFLIGQISHINIVHTAAILPWLFWALENYVARDRRRNGVLLAVIIAIQVFAGHQQTFAYSLILVGAYAIVMAIVDAEKRRRYFSSIAFMIAGVFLAAVQIVPTFELLRNSVRAAAGYSFMTSFSMPRRFVATFFAPYVMGGGDGRLFRAPYIGPPFYQELAGYVSILGIMLAIVAVFFNRDARTKFWLIVLPVALLLAFGSYAPLHLYRAIYFVPVLNLFRVPARHLMEVEFALAVLAGRGMMALQLARGNPRTVRRVMIVGGAVCLLVLMIVTWWRPADFSLGRAAPVSVLRAPELFMPILIAGLSAYALIYFARRRTGSTIVLIAVIVFDLVVWGQSSGWYTSSPKTNDEVWGVPANARVLRERASQSPGAYRILTAPHTFDPAIAPIPPSVSHSTDAVLWTQPDIYMLYGIQNAAGYDGFGLERYQRLAGDMKVWGELTDPNTTLRGPSREMDLLNVRYLVSMRKKSAHAEPTHARPIIKTPETLKHENYGGFEFASGDLGLPPLGSDQRIIFEAQPFVADTIALITNLSWAENVPGGAVIAHLHLTTKEGRSFDVPIRAGFDTAEWSYDRPDIHARIRHQLAKVATSYEVKDAQNNYQAHTYVTSLALPGKVEITRGEITIADDGRWPNLLLTVFRLSLVNSSDNKTLPVTGDAMRVEALAPVEPQTSKPQSDDRWKLVAETPDDIYENTRALPRAWLASETRVFDEPTMPQIIRTGKLPDGSKWDPLRTALVESGLPISSTPAANGRADITRYEPNRIDVRAESNAESVLVLSENHYPGWRAYVDGKGVDVMRIDYNLRGVWLTPGKHEVTFVYRPKSVMIGLMISLLTAALLFIAPSRWLPAKRRERND